MRACRDVARQRRGNQAESGAGTMLIGAGAIYSTLQVTPPLRPCLGKPRGMRAAIHSPPPLPQTICDFFVGDSLLRTSRIHSTVYWHHMCSIAQTPRLLVLSVGPYSVAVHGRSDTIYQETPSQTSPSDRDRALAVRRAEMFDMKVQLVSGIL